MATEPSNSDPPTGAGFVPVAIYTRVSTDNQVGGRFDSCDSQAAVSREFIRKHAAEGWREVACYTDAAYSGSTMDRPGLKALRRQIEAGEVKVVVIFKLERMSRNMDEWGPFRAFLQKHGCRLVSATEEISEAEPEGRLKNNIMMSVAEFERLNTAKKTRLKMLEQAKRGIWNGGMIPYGYGYDRGAQRLVPDPKESAVIRRVYEEAAKLVSPERIAGQLNAEGLRTKERVFRGADGTDRNVGARRFRSDGLRIIIANPVYRGVIRYKGNEYRGQHASLVSNELWEKANAAVEKTTRPAPEVRVDRDKHFHLLKGLAVCGCCNRALIPHVSGKKDPVGRPYRYYDCGEVVKERQDARCPVGRIAAGSLERAVVQYLGEVGRHPAIIAAAVGVSQTRREGRREELKKLQTDLDRKLAEVNKGIRNCIEAIATGGRGIAEELGERATAFKQKKQELVVERERVTQELVGSEREVLDERRVCESVEKFGKLLRSLAPAEQKALVQLFVERIEVRPGKRAPSESPEVAGERKLELRFKLNVPRLVDGMEERLIVETKEPRASLRRFTLSAEVALRPQGRVDQAQVVAPVRVTEGTSKPAPNPVPKEASLGDANHPLVRAMAWQRELKKDPDLSLRGLAKREGVVPPTITQHMKLLRLVPEIRDFVGRLSDPKDLYFFSLRRLMPLAEMSRENQLEQFREWRKRFEERCTASARIAEMSSAPVTYPLRPATAPRIGMSA